MVQSTEAMEMASPPVRGPLPTRVSGLPPLPPEYRAVLAACLPLVAPDLGGEARGAIDDHVRLLLAWNEAINLSGIREPGAIALEHVIDSLTGLDVLRRARIDEFVDLGSGAGFPGLTLALALPARRALLVESIGKKARFLEAAVAVVVAEGRPAVAGTVAVAASRAEELGRDRRHRGRWPCVVSRAVADLAELAELALPLLSPGGLLVAWKRQPLDEELRRGERALRQLGGRVAECVPVAVPGLEDHVLAVVEKVAATPQEYPRDPAARRRRPLGG